MLEQLRKDIYESEVQNNAKPLLVKMDKTFFGKALPEHPVFPDQEYKTVFGIKLEVVENLGKDYIIENS